MAKKYWLLVGLLAALKFALPFLLQHPVYELHRDEYLYYQQGQHLDFGFLENPSLIGLLAHFSFLFGGSFFWIKFWPALFGAGTLLVVAGMVKELGGGLFAAFLASLGLLFTAYLRTNFLFQPVFLEVFFWTLSAYFFIRYLRRPQAKDCFFLIGALALAWWTKYSALFFAASIFLSLLLSPQRTLFTRRHFWLAVLAGVALILPNVIWQWHHHWPLVHHMKELRETQLQYISKTGFLKEQLLLLFPVLFLWLGGLVWLLRSNTFHAAGWSFVFCVLLILLGSGKGYYTLGAYPLLLAAGGVWMEGARGQRYWLRFAVTTLTIILSLPLVPLLLPLQPPAEMAAANRKYKLEKLGILKWEDLQHHPLQQDFADMLGWRELSEKAERVFRQLPDSAKRQTVVYCRSYGQAGALTYYAQDPRFARKVISDNGTFLLWTPDSLWFRHLIFIGRRIPRKNDAVFQHFQKRTVVDSVTNPLSRQFGDKVIFFENASDSAWQLARQKLARRKAQFGR